LIFGSVIRASVMSIATPTLPFLVGHPAHFIALGGGAGLSPLMPGTVGTMVALPIAWLLFAHVGTVGWLIALALVTIIGAWSASITGRNLGAADHGAIVIDEIAAFLLVVFLVGADPLRQAIAFVVFRFFDIAKPPPIRQVDAAWKNGAGVMADDFIAAFYTLIVMAIGQRLLA
jgi:phosphatidylglycerophosphatase A